MAKAGDVELQTVRERAGNASAVATVRDAKALRDKVIKGRGNGRTAFRFKYSQRLAQIFLKVFGGFCALMLLEITEY